MIHLNRFEIEALIDLNVAAAAVEDAYRAASKGEITLPPVGHLTFPGAADCHIKYGYRAGDRFFVIKIATGFPRNAARGHPTGNGLVVVMSAETGAVIATLHDEMVLTDIRTGLGGAIATRALSRADSRTALIVGTGTQAHWQIKAHAALLPHLRFEVWGRSPAKIAALIATLPSDLPVAPAPELETAARATDVIVTATGATSPLIKSQWIQPGTHITAVGADAPGKQELECDLVASAHIRAVDLVSQCFDHGEFAHAAKRGLLDQANVRELGDLLCAAPARANTNQISIADLTGIAAQDIAMASVVLDALDIVLT
ncbi:MAG: ornithine cyclodeaminase family protein [Pseudomonadota bacterium]